MLSRIRNMKDIATSHCAENFLCSPVFVRQKGRSACSFFLTAPTTYSVWLSPDMFSGRRRVQLSLSKDNLLACMISVTRPCASSVAVLKFEGFLSCVKAAGQVDTGGASLEK